VLRIVNEEFASLTSEGRHQCQSFDGSPRSRRRHLRFHAKLLLKAVSFDAVIAEPVDVMGKTGRRRSSCQEGFGLPIGQQST